MQGSNLRHVKCTTMYIQTSSMMTASSRKKAECFLTRTTRQSTPFLASSEPLVAPKERWNGGTRPQGFQLSVLERQSSPGSSGFFPTGNLDFTTFSKQQKIRCVILDLQHEFTCSFEDDEQNSLDRHAHGGHVERLEHDMRHALSVGLEIQRIFREQVVMFPGRKQELVVESVVPDFLHGIPIRDDNRAQWYTSTSRHHPCSASRHHHNSLFDPFRPCCLAFLGQSTIDRETARKGPSETPTETLTTDIPVTLRACLNVQPCTCRCQRRALPPPLRPFMDVFTDYKQSFN